MKISIKPIESNILENLKKAPDEINIESLFNSRCTLHKEEAINAFSNIKQRMKDALGEINAIVFSYDPEEVIDFYNNNTKNFKKLFIQKDLPVH